MDFPYNVIQIMFLFSALVPISWYFFDHKCIFSVLSSRMRQETDLNEKNFSSLVFFLGANVNFQR